MLVLTANVGSGPIWLGDDIRIFVLEVRGRRVRLGFEAPESVVILRDEVKKAIEQEESDGKLGGLRGDGGHDEAATTEPVEGSQEEPGATGESG